MSSIRKQKGWSHLISPRCTRPRVYKAQQKCWMYTEMYATSFCQVRSLHDKLINPAANTATSKEHFGCKKTSRSIQRVEKNPKNCRIREHIVKFKIIQKSVDTFPEIKTHKKYQLDEKFCIYVAKRGKELAEQLVEKTERGNNINQPYQWKSFHQTFWKKIEKRENYLVD